VNRVGGVIVSVLASSAVDSGFQPPIGSNHKLWFWYLFLLR